MGYNDLRDIAPVLQGHACLYGQSIHAMFPQSFQMYTVVLEKQATKQLARLQELWWKQATEDLANEEAKWMYSCTRKTGHEATCPSSELWWKQATEDLANEEAKWVKLKDKKKASYRIRKGN
ncbi:hypothetical protein TNCV_3695001 [Trichonephila clavipes]|nr:hypothetical protein TNCV_3695001 [Trichonephila clavipes]